jgi:hypothetical protein
VEAIWQRCKSDLGLAKTEMFLPKALDRFFTQQPVGQIISMRPPAPEMLRLIAGAVKHGPFSNTATRKTDHVPFHSRRPMLDLSEHAGGLTAMRTVPRRQSS